MASNKLIGVVDVESGGDLFVFKSDFNFLASLNETVADPMTIYVDLANGKTDPVVIRGILIASVKSKNGEQIKQPTDEIETLITNYGLQECWLLCRHLLAYAMVGDEKKSKLRKLNPTMIEKIITEPFLLENSKNRRRLWAYHLLISLICVCINSSLFMLIFA